MDYKFKVGDRVRVITIDNDNYYGLAQYKNGDIGTITMCRPYDSFGNKYKINFDRLQGRSRSEWWALEHWLEPYNHVMVFE